MSAETAPAVPPTPAAAADATEALALEIDAADIVRVSVDYGKLQVILKQLMQRCAKLEKDAASKPALDDLASRLAALEAKVPDGLADRLKASAGDSSSTAQSPSTKDVDDRVTALERNVPTLDDRLKALESRPDGGALKDKVDELARDINRLKGSHTSPTGEMVPGLEDRVQRLEDGHAQMNKALDDELRPALAAQKEQLVALGGNVADIAGRHKALEDEYRPFRDKTNSALSALDKTDADLQEQIDAMRKDLNGLLTRRVPELEHAVAELTPEVAAVSAGLAKADEAIRGHDGAVADLTKGLSGLRDEVDALKAKLAAQDAMIGMLQPRSATDGSTGADAAGMAGVASSVAGFVENLEKLKRQLEELEKKVAGLQADTKKNADAIAENKDSADKRLAALDATTKGLEGTTKGLGDTQAQHDVRLSALEKVPRSAPTSATVAAAPASSTNLDKLAGDLAQLAAQLADATKQIAELQDQNKQRREEANALSRETTTLADQCRKLWDDKAGRDELNSLAPPQATKAVKATAATASPQPVTIDDGKLKAMRSDLDALAARVDDLAKALKAANAGGSGAGPADQQLQDRMAELATAALQDREWAHGQVVEIRATIEHIHHAKADAALVANKAERDYVENALEKLMREVEQVLNSTNAGLIDTLDKSLGILRDMIEGKASKADVAKLKLSLSGQDEAGSGNVPEGLAGFKSYRCLGCNRTVEAMRPRPMGASFASFMNRLPASPAHSGPGAGRPVSQGSAMPAPPAITQ